jgi:hypothetical protein
MFGFLRNLMICTAAGGLLAVVFLTPAGAAVAPCIGNCASFASRLIMGMSRDRTRRKNRTHPRGYTAFRYRYARTPLQPRLRPVRCEGVTERMHIWRPLEAS